NVIVRIPAALHFIEAAARSGQVRRARQELQTLDRWVGRSSTAPWLALAARSHALMADDEGDVNQHFEQALSYHRQVAEDHGCARTELLYGQHLRRSRRPAAAREHLRSALAIFEVIGAVHWAAQASAELRATGVRGDTVRRDAGAEGQSDTLTPQQHQIAELV